MNSTKSPFSTNEGAGGRGRKENAEITNKLNYNRLKNSINNKKSKNHEETLGIIARTCGNIIDDKLY